MGSELSKPKAEPKPERRKLRSFFLRGSEITAADESIPAVAVEQVSASPADLTAPESPTTSRIPESKPHRSTTSINAELYTTEITPQDIPVHDQVVNPRPPGPAKPIPGAPTLATVEYQARALSPTRIPTDIPSTTTATTTVALPIQSRDNQQETPSEQAEPDPQRTTSLWEQAWKNWATKSGESPSSGETTDVKLVDELIKDVKEKKGQCEEKRWFRVTKKGEKVFLMDTLLEQLNRYAMIGDLAIQHHPDIVALAWSGFRLLLQVGTAYTGAMKIVTDSLEYLVRILSICDIYERLYSLENHDSTKQLNNSIVQLYESIIEYLFYAKQYLEKNTVGRILDSFFSKLGELLSSIKTGEQEVDKWANSAEKEASAVGRSDQERSAKDLRTLLSNVQQPVERIGGVVEAIFKAVERERRLEILRWLSDVHYMDHHSYFTKRRHGDTGNWLLENKAFRDWEESQSSSLFWLRGDAGSGKTMLASMVIDDFSKNRDHHALAYFYCLYQDENRDSPENILRGLVKQICLVYPGMNLPTPLLSLYEDRENNGHSSGPPKLEESEELIVELSKGVWQTTIIIDALDECNPRTRGSLFSALKRIVSVASNIKIFVTARNDGDIDEKLRGFSNHYIHAVDNTGDINRFIDTEIERRCRPDDLKDGERSLLDGTASPDLKERIISTLKKKACGVFMWAHFQIIAICEEHIPADVEDALEKLPKDLDSTYRKVFERIDKQTEAARFTAREVLKWVLYGEDTSPELIIQALAVKPNETALHRGKLAWNTRKILSICHNLVVYDETLQKLRFAHLSVQEFLERHPDFTPKESTHCYIAEILMTVLINYHSSPNANDMPQLLGYSTEHWQVHVERSGTARSTYLDDCLKAFLKPGLAYDVWGSRIIRIKKELSACYGAQESWVPPFWVACYYKLYDHCRYMLSDDRDPGVGDGLSTTELLGPGVCEFKSTVQRVSKQDVVQLNLKNINRDTPLSAAAYMGHAKMLQLLLEKPGVDLNSKNSDGRTALSNAALRGKTEIVKLLLEMPGVDLNSEDKNGRTALSIAADGGKTKIVKLLLEMPGIDLNSKNSDGRTALSDAALRGNTEIVKLLLETPGIDLNSKNSDGRTALSIAAYWGKTEIAKLLLEMPGVDLNSEDKNSRTALSIAADGGKTEIVKLLLEMPGVDLNSEDKNGRTALSIAADGGKTEIAKLLLEMPGVDLNSEGKNGRTALSIAAYWGKTEIAKLLLEKPGVDLNSKASDGRTALSIAAYWGETEITKLLLEKPGVDLNSEDKNGRTALSIAADGGKTEIVKLLLEKPGVDLNSEDSDGKTALSIAAYWGNTEIVKLLLEKPGVDLNSKASKGRTALSIAAYVGKTEIAKLLLETPGVDLNSEDKYGRTALSRAALRGNTEIVKLLLEKPGVDLNSEDKYGRTALSRAALMGNTEIVKLLLETPGVGLNSEASDGRTALSNAALRGATEIVKLLLETPGVDLNSKDSDGKTALSLALLGGHTEIAELLNGHIGFRSLSTNLLNEPDTPN